MVKMARLRRQIQFSKKAAVQKPNLGQKAGVQKPPMKPVFTRLHQVRPEQSQPQPQPDQRPEDQHNGRLGRRDHKRPHGLVANVKAWFRHAPTHGQDGHRGPPPPQFSDFHHDDHGHHGHHRHGKRIVGLIIMISLVSLVVIAIPVLFCCFYRKTKKQLFGRLNTIIDAENVQIYGSSGHKLLLKQDDYTLYLAKNDFSMVANPHLQDYQAIMRQQPAPQVADFRRVVSFAEPQPQCDMRTRTNTVVTQPETNFTYAGMNESQTELNPPVQVIRDAELDGPQNMVSQPCNLPVGPPPAHHYPQQIPQNYYNYMVPAQPMHGIPQRVPLYTANGEQVFYGRDAQPKQK